MVFVFPPNTTLHIDLTLPDEKVIRCRGIVMWAKRILPAFNRIIQKHGMGIHLLDIPGEYKALIGRLHNSNCPETFREGSFLRYFRNERGTKRGDVKKIKGILPSH